MHNWRLLLLAFLAVLQPIASFTERNIVDGREQCCSRDSLQDSNLAHGNRFTKTSEDRRLGREIREVRRYEVSRENPVLKKASEKQLVEFGTERDVRRFAPEPTRFVRAELRREYAADIRRERSSASRQDDRERRVRETHRVASRDNSRDMREKDATRMRNSREDVRQQERDIRESSRFRATREGSRFTRDLDTQSRFRASLESRRETRKSRDNSQERRIPEIREARDVLQRARADVAREENTRARVAERMLEARRERSESRLQVDNNRERRSLERRVRETADERRSRTIDRVRELREGSRLYRERDERQMNRRAATDSLDDRRMQRDGRREYRQSSLSESREFRERSATERRDTRDADRARTDLRNIRFERSDTRRDSRGVERRARSRDERAASENRQTESRTMMDSETRHRDTERRDYRATDRIDIRESRRDARQTPSRSREVRQREISLTRGHRLANLMERDTRFRSNPELIRTKEIVASIGKIPEEQPTAMNWQYVFYTLQGVYLCGILMQLLTQKESDKKPRALSWFSAPQHLVKVD